LLLFAFLLVNAPNCHLLLVLASVVQGDAVNCNNCQSKRNQISNQLIYLLPSLWPIWKIRYACKFSSSRKNEKWKQKAGRFLRTGVGKHFG